MNEQKSRLRRKMLCVLKKIEAETFIECGMRASHSLVEQQFYQEAATVLSFSSFAHEANTCAINENALKDGKILLLPKIIDAKTSAMEFGDGGELPKVAPILVIVPGLAFSLSGKRLGRGGGYYDRYLQRLKAHSLNVTLAGFCLSCQILSDDELVTESHDVRMDYLITERGASMRCEFSQAKTSRC